MYPTAYSTTDTEMHIPESDVSLVLSSNVDLHLMIEDPVSTEGMGLDIAVNSLIDSLAKYLPP